MGNKQEELEISMQSQGYDLMAITETWWDSSRDWDAVMESILEKTGQEGEVVELLFM